VRRIFSVIRQAYRTCVSEGGLERRRRPRLAAFIAIDGSRFTVKVKETDSSSGGGAFKSTPVMWKGRVIIGARDGSLYCVGDR